MAEILGFILMTTVDGVPHLRQGPISRLTPSPTSTHLLMMLEYGKQYDKVPHDNASTWIVTDINAKSRRTLSTILVFNFLSLADNLP